MRLAIANVDGSGYREIHGPFPQARFGNYLAWASNGRVLFSTTSADQHVRVMRIDAGRGQPEFTGIEVLTSGTNPSFFDLSPDGTRVSFTTRSGGDSELWALDLSSLMKKAQ